jgi:hypothetical protein
MKKWYTTAVCGLALAFSLSAYAVPINITNNGDGTDDNFNDITGGGNQNIILFEWLRGEILSWNNAGLDPELPEPTPFLTSFDGDTAPTVDVAAGDYLVIHYGVGKGGTPGSGGGLVAYFFTEDESFQIPQDGTGPNGLGGFSFYRLWDHEPGNGVPDGATTAMLLGGALSLLGLVRRKFNA